MSTEDRRKSGRGLPTSTKTQVTGHMFLTRRAAAGITCGRVGMLSDLGRRRTMAIMVSIAMTVVVCLGALFWSLIRPAGSAGQSRILADQRSGALYVRVGDKLYPALNLASARLIVNEADIPDRVRRSEIDSRPRGPLVGIPGAPGEMIATSPGKSSWLVCDQITKAYGAHAPEPVTVTVIDGQPEVGDRRAVLADHDGLLRRYGEDVWLIRAGRRSQVDRGARSVLLALGLTEDQVASARPMSRALFDAIPVGAALSAPAIPDAGAPARFAGAPGPIGTVVGTPQVGGRTTHSVVLDDGMQTVSPIVAQILANTGTGTVTVPGPTLAKLPTVKSLDVSAYPDEVPRMLDSQVFSAACWHWEKAEDESLSITSIIAGPSIPLPQSQTGKVVDLVKADKSGWQADRVYFGPQYVNFASSTGNSRTSATDESWWWVSEWGVRFGVPRDQEAPRALGLTTKPSPAPWAALRLLAPGPALSRQDALLRHNTLPNDNTPEELEIPK